MPLEPQGTLKVVGVRAFVVIMFQLFIYSCGQSSKMKKSKDKWFSNQTSKIVNLGSRFGIAKKPKDKFQGTWFNCNKFGLHVERSIKPLGLIHTDVCGLKDVRTPNANKYFITFIDDYMKYCYVYLLNSNDEALNKFILYNGEYESPFGGYCEEHGIIY